MTWQAFIILSAGIGFLISLWLRFSRRGHGACGAMAKSPWGDILYFRNETWAITYYLFLGFIVFLPYFLDIDIWVIFFLLFSSSAAFAFSLYLFFLQKNKLKKWCPGHIALLIVNTTILLTVGSIFW